MSESSGVDFSLAFGFRAERRAPRRVQRPAVYLYVVEFISSGGASPSFDQGVLDPAHYLRGNWACAVLGSPAWSERFDVDAAAKLITHTGGPSVETVTSERDGTWHLVSADGSRDQTARAWTATGWFLRSIQLKNKRSTHYVRVDDDTFRRVSDESPAESPAYRLDTCRRDTSRTTI